MSQEKQTLDNCCHNNQGSGFVFIIVVYILLVIILSNFSNNRF